VTGKKKKEKNKPLFGRKGRRKKKNSRILGSEGDEYSAKNIGRFDPQKQRGEQGKACGMGGPTSLSVPVRERREPGRDTPEILLDDWSERGRHERKAEYCRGRGARLSA